MQETTLKESWICSNMWLGLIEEIFQVDSYFIAKQIINVCLKALTIFPTKI